MADRIKSREELDRAWDELDAKCADLINLCKFAVWLLVFAALVAPSLFLLVMWLFS